MRYERRNNWESITYVDQKTGDQFPDDAIRVRLACGDMVAIEYETVRRSYSDHGHTHTVDSRLPRLALNMYGAVFHAPIDCIDIVEVVRS